LIAIIDHSENKVVIIGDKLYRISFDEFSSVQNYLNERGLVVIDGSKSNVQSVLGKSQESPQLFVSQVNATSSVQTESVKEYVACKNGQCLVVNGLEPKLQFMGLDDFKTIDYLNTTYGKMPSQVKSLIDNGVLVLIDESEKSARINKMKEKQSVKGKKVQQSTSKSVRLAESSGQDDGQSDAGDFDDADLDVEDRVLRNAVKIDL
jgi:hypothetical protein